MENPTRKPQFNGAINRFLKKKQIKLPLFTRKLVELKDVFSVRLMDLYTDPLTIHYWVNMPYSYNFWGMKGATAKDIRDYYDEKMAHALLYPFIISYGKHPIALIEIYNVEKDELSRHIKSTQLDKGIHTLMAPPRYLLTKLPEKIRNISKEALVTALQFAFSFSGIDRIYTEPHADNFHANELARQMGWEFIKEIDMVSKKANLFCFEKQQFLEQYPL